MNCNKRKFQSGAVETIILVAGFMLMSIGISILGARNYYMLSGYKSEFSKFTPSNAELYTKANLYPVLWQLKNMPQDKETQEIKLIRKFIEKFKEKSGIENPEEYIDSAGPEISCSFFQLKNSFYYIYASTKLNICESEMTALTDALNAYYMDKERYPNELSELTPDYIEKIPLCPACGKYVYTLEGKDNQGFTIECTGNVHKGAGLSGNFPAYKGEKGTGDFLSYEAIIPETAYPDWLIAIEIRDREKIEELISRISEKKQLIISQSDYKNFKIMTVEGKKVNYCLNDKFLILSNDLSILKNSIDTSLGEKDCIENNKLYKDFTEKMPKNTFASIFCSPENLIFEVDSTIKNEKLKNTAIPLLKAMKSFTFTASGIPGGVKLDYYMNIDKNSDSSIIKILRDQKTQQTKSLEMLPADTTMISCASDVSVLWKVARDILEQYTEYKEKYNGVVQMFSLFTQLDIQKDLLDNFSGESTMGVTTTQEYFDEIKKLNIITKCENDLSSISYGISLYQEKNNGAIPENLEKLVPDYIEKLPSAPYNGKYIVIKNEKKEDKENPYPSFCVVYSGQFPDNFNIPGDYPRYSSEEGFTLGKDKNNKEIEIPIPIPDMSFIFGIKSKEPFEKLISLGKVFLEGKIKEYRHRGKTYSTINLDEPGLEDSLIISYSFMGDYLVLTAGKNKKPMEKIIDTSLKNCKSIVQLGEYNMALKKLPSDEVLSINYSDIKSLIEMTRSMPASDLNEEFKGAEEIQKAAEELLSIFSSTCSVSSKTENGYHWSLFMPLNFN